MSKKKQEEQKPKVHEDLKGFDIKINQFGELTTSLNIDRLNTFLNEKTDDKKFKEKNLKEEEE